MPKPAIDALRDKRVLFTDLQRYQQLLGKDTNRTAGESEQMHLLEKRDELKPFLPKPAS